jgi:hypothetical protein
MDSSQMKLAMSIAATLNYDGRQPPNWHGHVGFADATDQGLLITRSYASPQEGCNPERLTIFMHQGRVRLKGHDDRDQYYDLICPLSFEATLARVQIAVANGVRSVANLVVAIRTGESFHPSMTDRLAYEF